MIRPPHQLGLFRIPLPQATEDVEHEVFDHVQYLVIVLLKSHLKIQTCELCQMATGVAVLCTEDWPYLEHSLVVCSDQHLFVELW